MIADRILLTGATGHLGSAIAAKLLSRIEPDRVRLLIRSPEKLARLCSLDSNLARLADCEIIAGDLRDKETLATALTGVDAVVHAGYSHEYWRGTRHILDVNLEGTRRLAEAAAAEPGLKALVYIGSYSSHQSAAAPPSREDLEKRSARAASSVVKKTAMHILGAAAAAGGYRMHVVSPSYMLGPYQLDPTYFGALCHLVLFRPLKWYPPKGINLVDVRDVARCAVDSLAADNGQPQTILASGDDVSFFDIFTTMNRVAGHEVDLKPISPKLLRRLPRLRFFGDFGKYYFDKPHYVGEPGLPGRRYPLEDTIRDTVNFAGRTKLFRSSLHVAFSLAKRYL